MILKINPIKPELDKIRMAANAIREGKLAVFPTETVYGLGANALDDEACKRIFLTKGRPQDNPLIVHVSSIEMAEKLAEIPKEYLQKIRQAWPSPITFIVKKKNILPNSVTAGLETVALRMPAHPIALELIKEAGLPIAAPSANLSGKPSPTEASSVIEDFGDRIDIIIDGGPTFFGLESTVIDLETFTIARPGPFTIGEITKIFGKIPKIFKQTKEIAKPMSPGMKYRHYAPSKPLFLFSGDNESFVNIANNLGKSFCFIASNEICGRIYNEKAVKIRLGSSKNLYEIAKNLFSSLRAIDKLEPNFAICESFEEKGIGLAIMNRLHKACGGAIFADENRLKKFITAIK